MLLQELGILAARAELDKLTAAPARPPKARARKVKLVEPDCPELRRSSRERTKVMPFLTQQHHSVHLRFPLIDTISSNGEPLCTAEELLSKGQVRHFCVQGGDS